jgi:hypothetical protein
MAAWTHKNVACIATYNILEDDKLLNQFDEVFLKFDDAGAVKLSSLPYYPKFGAAESDIEGRAAQMSRYYFKHLVTLYTRRKENAKVAVEDMMAEFQKLFTSKTSTLAELATSADKFLKFASE